MKFIEMTGQTLLRVVRSDEVDPDSLRQAGVKDDSLVRVNIHGDIELRSKHNWDIIGGLIGDFEERVRAETGLDWA